MARPRRVRSAIRGSPGARSPEKPPRTGKHLLRQGVGRSRVRSPRLGFVRRPAASSGLPGGFVRRILGFVRPGCCIRCIIPGRMMRQMQHHVSLLCIRCNRRGVAVAADATTRAELMRRMQQPERRNAVKGRRGRPRRRSGEVVISVRDHDAGGKAAGERGGWSSREGRRSPSDPATPAASRPKES